MLTHIRSHFYLPLRNSWRGLLRKNWKIAPGKLTYSLCAHIGGLASKNETVSIQKWSNTLPTTYFITRLAWTKVTFSSMMLWKCAPGRRRLSILTRSAYLADVRSSKSHQLTVRAQCSCLEVSVQTSSSTSLDSSQMASTVRLSANLYTNSANITRCAGWMRPNFSSLDLAWLV